MFISWLLDGGFFSWFTTGNNGAIFWLLVFAAVGVFHVIKSKVFKETDEETAYLKVTIIK